MAHITSLEPRSSLPAILDTTVLALPTSSAWPMGCGAGEMRGLGAEVSDWLLLMANFNASLSSLVYRQKNAKLLA